MSLPKRDGVQGRYYLIQKPDTNPEVLEHADQCIQDVLNGTAKENHSSYPMVVQNQSGTPFLPSQLLDRYLSKLPLKGFPYEEAVVFCDALRRLVGWKEIGYTLEQYIKHKVQERYFEAGEKEDDFTPYPPCTVWPELRLEDVDENLLRFTCYVAVCYTVYGASYNTITTEHYLDLVSQLRPDMVKQLKTNGSGKLPKDIQRRKTEHFTASANDAFATIRITARDSTEECYAEILDYLCAVLEQEEFPRSYSVEFRGKEKLYLLFPACPKRESISSLPVLCSTLIFIRLWSDTLVWLCGSLSGTKTSQMKPVRCPAPSPCLPGAGGRTVGAAGDGVSGSLRRRALLPARKISSCLDSEVWVSIMDTGGIGAGRIIYAVAGATREFRSLIANGESLDALLAVKRRFSAYLLPEENEDPKFRAIAWQSLLWAIWGQASENGGSKVIKTAPKELKERYSEIFRSQDA